MYFTLIFIASRSVNSRLLASEIRVSAAAALNGLISEPSIVDIKMFDQ